MLKEIRADLHVHTCLSPCAAEDMLPTKIVARARKQNLGILAICDHNSAGNVLAVRAAAKEQDLQVFGGMEVTSSEEVHVLAFFEDDADLMKMQSVVQNNLAGENDEVAFGPQYIVDEHDNMIESCNKLLIGSTSLGLSELVELIHSLKGLAIASHIDREAFSVMGQLGFVPPDVAFDALEVSARVAPDRVDDYRVDGFPLVRSSDAHFVEDIGKAITTFLMESPSLPEVAMALRGLEGRTVRL